MLTRAFAESAPPSIILLYCLYSMIVDSGYSYIADIAIFSDTANSDNYIIALILIMFCPVIIVINQTAVVSLFLFLFFCKLAYILFQVSLLIIAYFFCTGLSYFYSNNRLIYTATYSVTLTFSQLLLTCELTQT